MKNPKDRPRCLPFMTGGSVVTTAVVLLLLTAHLTTAIPLRNTQRTEQDTMLRTTSTEKLKDLLLHNGRVETVNPLDHSADGGNPRVKRAPPRGGCQLGTCQVHNLADTLYRIGSTNGKDTSKKANDPKGYGRR